MLVHVSAFAASRMLSTTPLETEGKGGNEDFVARKLDDIIYNNYRAAYMTSLRLAFGFALRRLTMAWNA